MKIGKLVRDPALLPPLPKKATFVQEAAHKGRSEFLLQRARAALTANPSWRGVDPDEVKAANETALKTLLTTEVGAAATKVATLRTAMADPTQTERVGIDTASIDPPRAAAGKKARFAEVYAWLIGRGPQQLRVTGILAAAWLHLAEDPSISDADLHTLVSRRLMVAERMLWYVGAVGSDRPWGKTAANKWNGTDGWKRMFEYPRLPVTRPLIATCNLTGSSTTCDANGGLKDWTKETRYTHNYKVTDGATTLWNQQSMRYAFFYNDTPANDPIVAIETLFAEQDDFRKRNLLMCDHVIHCLLLESLVRVKSKRDGNRTWLKPIVSAAPAGWLRIYASGAEDGNPFGPRYLASDKEPRFFSVNQMDVSQLLIGDHVIVFNHPAYDMAKDQDDVWRLENAVVVAHSPRLLLQGHGTLPIPFTSRQKPPVKGEKNVLEPSMRKNMLGLFNNKLERLRTLAKNENAQAAPRLVISGLGSAGVLVQRTTPGPYSGYDDTDFTPAAEELARWWIRWDHDTGKGEHTIAADPAWAKSVWDHQRVELVASYGYFPLWLPKLERGQPVRKNGKIALMGKVWVSQSMAPGWNWYYEKNETPATAHRASVRRPKVS